MRKRKIENLSILFHFSSSLLRKISKAAEFHLFSTVLRFSQPTFYFESFQERKIFCANKIEETGKVVERKAENNHGISLFENFLEEVFSEKYFSFHGLLQRVCVCSVIIRN